MKCKGLAASWLICYGSNLTPKPETMESANENKLVPGPFEVSWELLIYKTRNNNAYAAHYKEIYNDSLVLESGEDIQK